MKIRTKVRVQTPRIELGTYCVLNSRHNQLDHACTPNMANLIIYKDDYSRPARQTWLYKVEKTSHATFLKRFQSYL